MPVVVLVVLGAVGKGRGRPAAVLQEEEEGGSWMRIKNRETPGELERRKKE